ncbi:protein kinase domain-containing protein [Capilliphycus salinus ALCB114379]|uniref:protein kinase domain-containing protein n=1 Tax=Capilliphycus salinus TaxID=2768948 RepID=UPI0039A566E3
MSYCLNPHCTHPQNSDDSKFCLTCGAKLLLRERYRAIKPIGFGGFGKTFLAIDEDKPSRPPCVIKQFFPQTQGSQNTAKAVELFHQEAVRLDQLGKHPQIPDLLAHFEQDKNLYLVQEYIEGENLEQELSRNDTFNEAKIRQLLDDLLPVLQFIHTHQVIHRDIKPANIIRRSASPTHTSSIGTFPGQLVLVDFGAAKVVTTTQLPLMGTVIGSPEYIAPEQTRGQAVYASDIYSLGVTCIHLLTQVSPFDLFDINEDRWIWRDYLKGQPFSAQLGRVLDKMLMTIPSQRYQTPVQVLNDLHPDGIPANVMGNIQLHSTSSTVSPNVTPTRKPTPSPSVASTPKTTSVQTSAPLSRQTPVKPQRVTPKQAPSWSCLYTLKGHRSAVTSLAFSSTEDILASGSQDQTIEIWQLERGKRWYTLTGHTNWVTSIAISPNGEILASGSRDRTIEIWDLKKGKRWYTLTGHQDGVEVVAFSPKGEVLASGSRDHTIEIWDMKKGKRWYTLSGHSDRIYGLAFSPDGRMLASGSKDNTVRLWDLQKARELDRLEDHSDWVRSVAFRSDGQQLASGSRDGMIKLWQPQGQRWTVQRTLRADQSDVFSIAYSPNGQLLASGNQHGIDLWDVHNGTLLETLTEHSSDILFVTFCHKGLRLASGSYDGTVKVWQR